CRLIITMSIIAPPSVWITNWRTAARIRTLGLWFPDRVIVVSKNLVQNDMRLYN
ncbi:hypothetical protein L9F63_009339, partial [Diploptera punctata]